MRRYPPGTTELSRSLSSAAKRVTAIQRSLAERDVLGPPVRTAAQMRSRGPLGARAREAGADAGRERRLDLGRRQPDRDADSPNLNRRRMQFEMPSAARLANREGDGVEGLVPRPPLSLREPPELLTQRRQPVGSADPVEPSGCRSPLSRLTEWAVQGSNLGPWDSKALAAPLAPSRRLTIPAGGRRSAGPQRCPSRALSEGVATTLLPPRRAR
jgi:hypothetical protein